ncbi:hypothetical protein HMPREF3166_08290 [Corynebacterium sp. HMSC08A12]|uniref:hypothetical protein n=1 Tax=Corynebacterium sp. HMSC08A12 TaxID=1581134 RepID=UPI0008A6242C|nr:hypothetical protein [Corynebacterium sp. HMSC08A12]OFT33168.1 hypothetical protein HMPREF3166_08290 [Corynebacterium sp. HMSC08A12]
MASKFVRSATAIAAASALAFGGVSVASAAPAGSLGGLTGSLGGKKGLDTPEGDKVKLGNVGGPAWNVDVYKQVHGATTVAPGATVKTRVVIQGVKGKTRIDEVLEWMPKGFKLVKVERMKGGLLGNGVHELGQGEYAVTENKDRTEVRVSWEEGLLIKQKPTVDTATPLLLDFTWKAPEKEGTYKNGAGAKVGAAVNNNKVFDNGTPIVVKKGAAPAGSGASGSLSGSLSGS